MADDPRAAAPELTEQVQQGLRRAIPETFRSTPFMSGLNISFDRYEPDDVVVRLPFSEALTNDGVVYHGGVIATMIDTAGAAAAWSNHDFNRGTRAATPPFGTGDRTYVTVASTQIWWRPSGKIQCRLCL